MSAAGGHWLRGRYIFVRVKAVKSAISVFLPCASNTFISVLKKSLLLKCLLV